MTITNPVHIGKFLPGGKNGKAPGIMRRVWGNPTNKPGNKVARGNIQTPSTKRKLVYLMGFLILIIILLIKLLT